MNIRKAEKYELSIIADIHVESWRSSYSSVFASDILEYEILPSLKKHWKHVEIKNNDVVLVADLKEIVGFIAAWCRPRPFIDNLHVRPSCQSQKVGTLLMKALAKSLLNDGHKTAYLWVFSSNEKAIKFYERLGGVKKESEIKEFFGHKVLSTKIEWADISSIIANG